MSHFFSWGQKKPLDTAMIVNSGGGCDSVTTATSLSRSICGSSLLDLLQLLLGFSKLHAQVPTQLLGRLQHLILLELLLLVDKLESGP